MYEMPRPELVEQIYTLVCQIPHGMVSSYGDVAQIIGDGLDGRAVGVALGALPAALQNRVPWQRVVSQSGAISTRGLQQRALLEAEGVAFDAEDRIIMARHRWAGPAAAACTVHSWQPLPPRAASEQLSLF